MLINSLSNQDIETFKTLLDARFKKTHSLSKARKSAINLIELVKLLQTFNPKE